MRRLCLAAALALAPVVARAQSAAEILADANEAARLAPNLESFAGARVTYPYAAGALYELIANPAYVSTLLLEPGEAVTAIAAGDTSRWSVTQAESEAAEAARALIMIKPAGANLRTNFVIVTDRRSYVVEARSSAGRAYVAEMAWSYPQPTAPAPPDAGALRFDYRVRTIRGRAPVWTPALVFDDGARTYLEFPEGIEAADMPPLFIISAEGGELANYRVQGRRYVVDRVFETAELRLGVRAPVIVRIERRSHQPARQQRVRRGRS